MRITINGDYDDVRIQRSVPLNLWNAAKGCSKGRDRASVALNAYIAELHARALEKHKELVLEQALITPKLILKRVFGKDTEMRTLLGTMREGIKEMETLAGIDYSPVTNNRYKNVVKKLQLLIPSYYGKEDVTFHELTPEFIRAFDIYLKTEAGLCRNTIVRYMKCFKKFTNMALAKDFTIMSNHHLRNTELSLKAKGLLSLMLSLPEDWDYTTKGLAHICKDGVDSITTALKELERHGYLTRQRLRYDNGQLGDIEYTIHEQPVSTENTGLSPKRENPRQVKPEQAKPKQAEPEQENPAQLNTNPLKTKKSKKDKSITYPSIYPAEPEAANRTDGMDRIELIEAYREIIKENIEYDLLVLRYGRERLDEALELMLEVILSKRPYIRIAGDDFPREIVKSRFLKINSGHLEYVFDCIDKNTTKVGNIKAYLLAALYNAPATMDSYYRAEVNHDLYGC